VKIQLKTRKIIFFVSVLTVLASAAGLSFCYLYSRQIPLTSSQNALTLAEVSREIPTGVILWSKKGNIIQSHFKEWHPKVVAKGKNPRWSPDGKKILFTREHDTWIMDRNGAQKKLIENTSDIGAYWTRDGSSVTAINRLNPRQVIRYNLKTQKISIVHDEAKPPFRGYQLEQCAELRSGGRFLLTFTQDDGHRSMVIDLVKKTYIMNEFMEKGDCNPSWSPDGRFIIMTRRSIMRPIYLANFLSHHGSVKESRYLVGKGRCHNGAVSNNSKYVVYSSSGDIYLWKVDAQPVKYRHGTRLTFDADQNINPSVFIF
jgi:hypothetical protein|tara:strand:+ start:13804 stop:14748 length:945 start_codon:yes stop_codon:yes gene_type:complete